jgi:hypothetical protein
MFHSFPGPGSTRFLGPSIVAFFKCDTPAYERSWGLPGERICAVPDDLPVLLWAAGEDGATGCWNAKARAGARTVAELAGGR